MAMVAMTSSEEEMTITKGPWTEEEDSLLYNYITLHGQGHWNSVASYTGLKRTGKSCRLRWLNYLRPNVRRGNISLQEQLLILHLHSRWGNRWSKIAEHLPGRTDNEIKNYWRTRVVKQAKQLKCDVNSKQFRDTLRFVWIPRMVERIQAQASSSSSSSSSWEGEPQTNAHSCGSSTLHVNPPSVSDSYNLPGAATAEQVNNNSNSNSNSSTLLTETDYSYTDIVAADFWTHENISFLQQQLADEL
ncbi:hypothetical protein VNO78_18157 [Psophocarpus tetragonolobus]|uniref:Uncharacterized protein n=1 Tax=Psophocarpus tetragonolobus TaxID=3891 RepID=A0AAN9SHV0_PSOTE